MSTSTAESRTEAAPKERVLTVAKGMVEGIAQEMERDPSVFVLGEDVGAYGGIFSSTTGLLDKFGPERVLDTPISESAFMGLATGAAVEGLKPIVELMFVDFMGVCLDQIYNHMAKIHYESGGNVSVPVVVTTAVGGGYSDGAQHSQCLWGTFAHLPGMKVVIPSNAYDAKGLMVSAIRDPNPVVYLFHKGIMGLPWMAKQSRAMGPVPTEIYEIPFGKAATVRQGSDITLVTVSMSVHHASDAAEQLATEGIDCEILDLRTLVPLDVEGIVESVRRTGRLLVIDEDYLSYGMSAEVLAVVAERDPGALKAPPRRLAMPDAPIPYSPVLEQAALPTSEKIVEAVRSMMADD